MTKKIITLAAVAGLMLFIFMFARSCYFSDKLKAKEKEYTEYRAIADESYKQMSVRLDAATQAITLRDKAIIVIESKLVEKKRELAAAQKAYKDLVDSEPVQPDLEKEPLVVNLRAQIGKLNGMVSLVQDISEKQASEITELKGKVELLEQVGAEWKGAYEREHTLRLQAEDLYKVCSRSVRANRFWRTVGIGGTVAGMVVGYLSHK